MPTYAGIPITYPGGGDTVTFVRGHEDEGRQRPHVDWASLAKLEGTVVCSAGPRQLASIIDALLSHGRSATEPAAIIVNGTLLTQHTVDRDAAGTAQREYATNHLLVRRCWLSARWWRYAIIYAGSMRGRCSGGGCS